MKYREMYLVEKCINTLTNNYMQAMEEGYHSAKQNFCIDFINFLNENDKEYVDYGIKYIIDNYKDVVDETLLPILAEYKYSGTSGELHWDPIPETITQECPKDPYGERNIMTCPITPSTTEPTEYVEETKQYNIDTNNCSVKEKIVLFVMKLLRL